MVQSAHRRFTFREYLALEAMSPNVKHEFVDGQVLAMAGGTLEPAGIAANVISLLAAALAGRPCRVFTSDPAFASAPPGSARTRTPASCAALRRWTPKTPTGPRS